MAATDYNNSDKNQWVRTLLVPFIVGGLAVSAAIIGALLTGSGADATGGVNGFVEGLSGSSGSRLGGLGLLGFTFGAGMVSTVNPCGFAMLPAYLGMYLGATDSEKARANATVRFKQAFLVGTLVTLGVMLHHPGSGANHCPFSNSLAGPGNRHHPDLWGRMGAARRQAQHRCIQSRGLTHGRRQRSKR
jgi:hypothetical protein